MIAEKPKIAVELGQGEVNVAGWRLLFAHERCGA
jgi:hypothetical protein